MRRFTAIERTAIGELVEAAMLMTRPEDGQAISPIHRGLAVLFLERAARIVRGQTKPFTFTQAQLEEFCEHWNTDEPAQFSKEIDAQDEPRRRPS